MDPPLIYTHGNRLNRFLKTNFFKNSTLRLNDKLSLTGFLCESDQSQYYKKLLDPYLSQKLGDFKVKYFSSNFENVAESIMIIIPENLKDQVKNKYFKITGIVKDLSDYLYQPGRFIEIENLEPMDLNNLFLSESPAIDAQKLARLLESNIDGPLKNMGKYYLISAPVYFSMAGGVAVGLVNSDKKFSKYNNLVTNKKVSELLNEINSLIHPIFKSSRLRSKSTYKDSENIQFSVKLPLKYLTLKKNELLGRLSGKLNNNMETPISTTFKFKDFHIESERRNFEYLEDPLILYNTDLQLNVEEIKEYSFDIGHIAMLKHLEMPENTMNITDIDAIKEQFLYRLEKEFPLLREAMVSGEFMDISIIGGTGEHLIRLIEAGLRFDSDLNSVKNRVFDHLLFDTYDRISDMFEPDLKKFNLNKENKTLTQSKVDRVLFELNNLYPGGWPYENFEYRLSIRDLEPNQINHIFQELRQSRIKELKNNRYKAVL